MYEYILSEHDPYYWYFEDYPFYLYLHKYIDCDDPVKVFADDEFKRKDSTGSDWSVWGKNPYYQLRGKPVTHEQAVEIIAKTNDFFSYALGMNGSICFSLFQEGWVQPCGSVCQNACFLLNHAELNEMVKELIPIVHAFPYLDMVAAVSTWNCMPPEEAYAFKYKFKYFKYGKNDHKFFKDDCDENNFFDRIQIGIWIHDRKIEFIDSDKTVELYMEYDKFYTDQTDNNYNIYDSDLIKERFKIYSPDKIYGTGNNYTYDSDLIKECFKVYGVENMEEYFGEMWNNVTVSNGRIYGQKDDLTDEVLEYLKREYGSGIILSDEMRF